MTGFASITAFSETSLNMAEGGEMRRVNGIWVSGDFFNLFGMRPAAGRLLQPADDVRGCPATAVLGHGFWQSEFGGRADAITTLHMEVVHTTNVSASTKAGFADVV